MSEQTVIVRDLKTVPDVWRQRGRLALGRPVNRSARDPRRGFSKTPLGAFILSPRRQ
jgi:hypothetical protein